ncbi:MAG: TRAP transporter fused permease subunit [Deltaproteobacteria bacterium]|nr:TRAP transporter fused permease subunit [Deltaproteobacteria bacterium]
MLGFERVIAVVMSVLAIAMAIYQLLYTQFLVQSPDAHIITHLDFALVVVFLSLILKEKGRKGRILISVLLFLSLAVTVYLMVELNKILEYRTSIPATSDLIAGTLIILVLLIGNRLVFGKTFTIVSLVAITYLGFGRYLPAPFTVPPISYQRLLMWLSVELGSGKGVYGNILDLSATYLFLFIFFGGVLHTFGGTDFIIGLGRWIGSRLWGGPAMVALFGSAFLGTVTGSTVANITITGSFTIPMMKKSGYSPEQAGAIETVVSNGGQITPPIMGATAFLMAGFAGIPYLDIVKASIIPALLYRLCVFIYITLRARKMRIRAGVDTVPGRDLLLQSPVFILPLGVLIFFMVKGFTLPYVGFWSIVTVIISGLVVNILRKDKPFALREIFQNLVGSVRSACGIAMICGLLGVVVSAIVSSGLAVKLSLAIEDLSRGILPLALIITMISSMVLGIGVPTPAAYMLVAVGAVPSLLNMGVPVLAAHLFCFVSAISSHITPPIAIGALVASQIAGANYWKTACEAVKAAFAKYLLPFFFVYAPVVLLRPDRNLTDSFMQLVGILMLIFSLQVGVSQHLLRKLKIDETVAFLVGSLVFIFSVFAGGKVAFLIGVIFMLFGTGRQLMHRASDHGNHTLPRPMPP